MVAETAVQEKPITVRNLIDYLEEYNLPYESLDGVDAKCLAEDLGVEYPWQSIVVDTHHYVGEFDGSRISHFITVADNLVVWAIYGTIFEDEEPTYAFSDKAVRIK
jgi:hypothetical protein